MDGSQLLLIPSLACISWRGISWVRGISIGWILVWGRLISVWVGVILVWIGLAFILRFMGLYFLVQQVASQSGFLEILDDSLLAFILTVELLLRTFLFILILLPCFFLGLILLISLLLHLLLEFIIFCWIGQRGEAFEILFGLQILNLG
jgi:hypothetical protein